MKFLFDSTIIHYLLAVLVVWVFVFILTTGLPDASMALSGGKATAESLQHVREELQLDQPLQKRFFGFWKRLFQGELRSYYSSGPLHTVLIEKLKISGTLLLSAFLSLLLLTLGWLALLSVFRSSSWAISLLIGLTSSVPLFISLPILLFVCGRLGISSVIGGGLCLAIYPSMLIATNLIDLTGRKKTPPQYIILASQCGLRGPAWLAMKLRASHSAVQIFLNCIAFFVLVGIPVAELMLGLPGAGRWMLESILRIDLPVVYLCATLATLLCAAIFFVNEIYSAWAGAKEAV